MKGKIIKKFDRKHFNIQVFFFFKHLHLRVISKEV